MFCVTILGRDPRMNIETRGINMLTNDRRQEQKLDRSEQSYGETKEQRQLLMDR